MRFAASAFCVLLALVALVPDASANRRGVRVDGFGVWDTFDDPNALCPGWSNGSTLLLGPGYVFSGRDVAIHLTDTYCQIPSPGALTQGDFFYADETALAAMIGPNLNDAVTAVRYSMLDALRFSGDATGFQWTFYYFPEDRFDPDPARPLPAIVGLYGLEAATLGNATYISFNGTRLFDAARDGFTGQYFCFEGLQYAGTWDGLANSPSPCQKIGHRLFKATFD